jgi:type II secretory pathway pseudopilin PulG
VRPSRFTERRAQRGDALLEALVGIVLMAVLTLGAAYALSRAQHAQRFTGTQQKTLVAMRELLSTQGVSGLCATGTGVADGQALTANCSRNGSIVVDPKASDGTTSLGLSNTLPSITQLSSLATGHTKDTQARYGGDGVLQITP